jgi:hypothetical protein
MIAFSAFFAQIPRLIVVCLWLTFIHMKKSVRLPMDNSSASLPTIASSPFSSTLSFVKALVLPSLHNSFFRTNRQFKRRTAHTSALLNLWRCPRLWFDCFDFV